MTRSLANKSTDMMLTRNVTDARAKSICCVIAQTGLHRAGVPRHSPLRVGTSNCYATLWHHLLCIAQTVFTRGGARHSPTSRYMQLLCCARASFVVHCTNCLHERGARHSHESVYATAMLRSGIICCALYKLSSRTNYRFRT